MDGEIEIAVLEEVSHETWQHVLDGLVAFNESHAGPARHRYVSVLAQRNGEVVGGLFAYTNWDWLCIAQLWVAESVRGRGVGKQLIGLAEAEARRHGCRHAHVDTFSFQALPFYERLGYRVFGRIENYPAGHARYFLEKRDLHGDAAIPESGS